MFRYGLSTLALLAVLAFSANSQAGALSLLTLDGVSDHLEDNDYEAVVDRDASGTLSSGDMFVGMFEIQSINSVGVTTSTFEGVFVAKIDSVTPGGTFGGAAPSTLTFVPLSALEYATLSATYTNLPTRTSLGTEIFVYDTTGTSPFVNPDGAGTGTTGQNNALLTATDGSLVAEFGVRDGDEVARADVNRTALNATPGVGLFAAGSTLQFALGLNVTYNNVPWLTFHNNSDVVDSGLDSPPLILSGYELYVTGARDPALTPLGDFLLGTDANFEVNVTPEPGSLTLLGMGALGFLGVRLRRRNAA